MTYLFMIGSPNGSSGGLLPFSVTGQPALKIGVMFDQFSSVDARTGAATISGTVTCTRPIAIGLNGTVRQKLGRFVIIQGWDTTQAQCSGVAPWRVTISSPDGAFGGGAAVVSVVASAFDPLTGEQANVRAETTVQLRSAR